MSLKVLRMELKNIGGVDHLVFEPEGRSAMLEGPNASGKTRIQDGIIGALTGNTNLSVGEAKGSYELTLLDSNGEPVIYTVVRKVTAKSTSVKVFKGAHRDEAIGASDFLKAIKKSALSFDPLEFDRMSKQKRMDCLMVAVGIDPETYRAQRKALFDQRTDKNRLVRDLEGELNNLPPIDTTAPAERVNASELIDFCAKQASVSTKRLDWERRSQELARRVEAAQSELEMAQAAHENHDKEEPDGVDVEALEAARTSLKDIEGTNRIVDANHHRFRVAKDLRDKAAEADDLSKKITKLDEERLRAIRDTIDIEGVTIDGEEGICVSDGVPYDRDNRAARIRFAVDVRAAMSDRLGFILIDDASELDDASMAELRTIAESRDIQVIVSRVNPNPKASLHIVIDAKVDE